MMNDNRSRSSIFRSKMKKDSGQWKNNTSQKPEYFRERPRKSQKREEQK